MIKIILTDIEGTTTALDFVKLQLFPYAAKHLEDYVLQHESNPEIKNVLNDIRVLEKKQKMTTQDCIKTLQAWIKEDRKVTPLKTLQGILWAEGYKQGELIGHVYPDVVAQLKTWHMRGLKLAVFSSGSVLAQKLLFSHTEFGDLTKFFSNYFDTNIGAKKDAAAYKKISDKLDCKPNEILFLSDSIPELDAAEKAGMKTCQLIREGCEAISDSHPTAYFFNEIILEEK